jgi:hypothetical protein
VDRDQVICKLVVDIAVVRFIGADRNDHVAQPGAGGQLPEVDGDP